MNIFEDKMELTTEAYFNIRDSDGLKFEVKLPSLATSSSLSATILTSEEMIYLILVRYTNGALFIKYGCTKEIEQRMRGYMKDHDVMIIKPLACFATPRYFQDGSYTETKLTWEKALKHEIGMKADRGNEYYRYSDKMLKHMFNAMLNVANVYADRGTGGFLMFWKFNDDLIPIYNRRKELVAKYNIYTNMLIKI